jgi:hypothetical protein
LDADEDLKNQGQNGDDGIGSEDKVRGSRHGSVPGYYSQHPLIRRARQQENYARLPIGAAELDPENETVG